MHGIARLNTKGGKKKLKNHSLFEMKDIMTQHFCALRGLKHIPAFVQYIPLSTIHQYSVYTAFFWN